MERILILNIREGGNLLTSKKDAFLGDAAKLLQQGQFDKALKNINQAIKLDPQDAQSYGLKAACLVNSKRLPEALQACNAGLQIDPKLEILLTTKAMALAGTGNAEEALQVLQEVTKLHPESKQAWVNLATMYQAAGTGKFKVGVIEFLVVGALEKALALDPNDIALLYKTGALYGYGGDYINALKYFERVAAINPNFQDVQHLLNLARENVAKGVSHPLIPLPEKKPPEAPPPVVISPAPLASLNASNSPAISEEKFCTQCGSKLPGKAKFCNKCGTKA